jgi:kynurenine formamidase
LFYTGRGELFDDPAYEDFPSLSGELCRWAVDQRLGMVGTDSLSPDLPLFRRDDGFDFIAHHTLLGAGLLIGENLRNLGGLAGRRVRVRMFPLPVVGGDGAPTRILAEI